jgi:hypothetical protein
VCGEDRCLAASMAPQTYDLRRAERRMESRWLR